MRFQKVLLISPRYPGSHYVGGRSILPPIGLGIIGEMLTRCGVDYEVLDLGLGYAPKHLQQRIATYQPEAIGISMMTFRYTFLYTLLQDVKTVHPQLQIIAGGPHLTAWRSKVLAQCAAIDFGIVREGELTIQELCEGKPLAEIQGLIYRAEGEIVANADRDLIANLDSIPFPRYAGFELARYERIIPIISSRGCPYQCIFCQSCSILGKKWRSRSATHIADEIQFWHEHGYSAFSFADDNFTLNKARIYALCDELERRQLLPLRLAASGIRVDLVDEHLLQRMKEIGFWYIAFGIEAGNNRILVHLKKGITIEQAHQSVKKAVEFGFAVKLYFLVGSPYETLQDLQDSIDFARTYLVCDVNFGSLMPIPETELMDWVTREGKLLTPPEIYLNEYAEFERLPHFDAPGMTLQERRAALKLTQKIRKSIQRRYRKAEILKKVEHLGIFGHLIAEILSFELVGRTIHGKYGQPVKALLKKMILRP